VKKLNKNKKVILVTGASRGLGRVLSEKLSSMPENIVYAGVRKISQAPLHTKPVHLDLTDDESIIACRKQIINEENRIDYIVHNAGIAYYGPVDAMTTAEVQTLYQTNVFGPIRLTQLFLQDMRSQREGKILFISSIRGVESYAYMGMYSGSKAAIEAIAFDWAVTLSKWNIEVSVVQPGPMDTGIQLFHGTHFDNFEENPYLPYKSVKIEFEKTELAANTIISHLLRDSVPFRVQTSPDAHEVVKKHLRDPSGMKWLLEQKSHL